MRESAKEFEQLGTHARVCIEDEGEEGGKDDADWLREGRVDGPRADGGCEVGEGVAALGVGFGAEEGDVVCELCVRGGGA